METKKYYWIKLKRDFFKRHDIKIIESMPNGKDYILFYLKLLCESVDHDGNLRFSEQIPYNEEMLSVITNTNIDIVRSAIKVFTELNMMDLLDDGTYYLNEVNKMIGSAVDNDNANRQRRYRERQKQLALQNVTDNVTNNNESKSKEIELDKEKDKDNLSKENNKENLDLGTAKVSQSEILKFIQEHKLLFIKPTSAYNYININEIEDWKTYLLELNKKQEGLY